MRACEPDTQAISITHGYSCDHRPDLKQVVAQIITGHKSALPVWLEVLSGNSSDKALAERQLRQTLAEDNQTLPDQKGKPTQVPAMRWVFQILIRQLRNLRLVHIQILRLFAKPVQNCHFLAP